MPSDEDVEEDWESVEAVDGDQESGIVSTPGSSTTFGPRPHHHHHHPDQQALEPESSAAAARRGEREAAEARQCAVCGEEHLDEPVFRAPCGHLYCAYGLQGLFRGSMEDETLFPPRCCLHAIVLADARPLLGEDLSAEFEHKSVELSTQNRTYCHQPGCATFIPPASIQGDIGTCPTCHRTTCTMCKAALAWR